MLLFFFLFCCSINGVSPKVRKILQLFRLLQIHNGVFIKLNKATMNMLRVVQPYVAYGLVQLFFFFFGCIKYMYCAWFSHISLCKEHPMWHLVGWPSLALSEWLLELSVLETHHSWCLFLAHVIGDQNCPQCLFFRELVWCSTLYIPCASQSHFVTLTGAINHTMDI